MENVNLQAVTDAVIKFIFVELEASGRHVHVTSEQAQRLFGHGLTPKRPLSQPGQFLANERLTVIGPKGQFENVAVLGPERKNAQVEISLTDARSIGVAAPIRESGDIAGTGACKLVGPAGEVELTEGVIAAKRHIHMTTADAAEMGLKDKDVVSVKIDGEERGLVFDQVVVRVNDAFALAMHIDTDESNAACVAPGTMGEVIK